MNIKVRALVVNANVIIPAVMGRNVTANRADGAARRCGAAAAPQPKTPPRACPVITMIPNEVVFE